MFNKDERSSFPYWFAHYCAFQMTALNLHHWKIKYLFHDMEKPWLKLILGDYKKVQKIHRKHNRHHLEYEGIFKHDWEGMLIDWECSRFTKETSPKTASEMIDYLYNVKKNEVVVKNIDILNKTLTNLGLN